MQIHCWQRGWGPDKFLACPINSSELLCLRLTREPSGPPTIVIEGTVHYELRHINRDGFVVDTVNQKSKVITIQGAYDVSTGSVVYRIEEDR